MMDPTPAPRLGHTFPDVSDQKNLQCNAMNEMVSPKLVAIGKQHKEAQKSPAQPQDRVFKRDIADPSTRSPTEAIDEDDMAKAASSEITDESERKKRLSGPYVHVPISPSRPYSGPTRHHISDEQSSLASC